MLNNIQHARIQEGEISYNLNVWSLKNTLDYQSRELHITLHNEKKTTKTITKLQRVY